MTLNHEIQGLAATAKHNRAELALVDWRPILLQVGSRLDLLDQVKYAHEVYIVRDEMEEYAKVTITMTLGPDTLAALMDVMSE